MTALDIKPGTFVRVISGALAGYNGCVTSVKPDASDDELPVGVRLSRPFHGETLWCLPTWAVYVAPDLARHAPGPHPQTDPQRTPQATRPRRRRLRQHESLARDRRQAMTDKIRFVLGYAAGVADLDVRGQAEGDPLFQCTVVGKHGKHGTIYEGDRDTVLKILRYIENCPAYTPPGWGWQSEGFAGDYAEAAAVRRASDHLRKKLGLELRGFRRKVRRKRRKEPSV